MSDDSRAAEPLLISPSHSDVSLGGDIMSALVSFGRSDWDRRWLRRAEEYASWSKDPSTKVGAVLIGGRHEISGGYNGFPVGADDAPALYLDRPLKYERIVHAEANAVAYAARYGRATAGATLYTTFPICPVCTGIVINAGIRVVHVQLPKCEYCERREAERGTMYAGRVGPRVLADSVETVYRVSKIPDGAYFHTVASTNGNEIVRCGLPSRPSWLARFEISKQLFHEAGIPVVQV